MKKELKKLLVSIFIPLCVGGLSALLTSGSMQDFKMVEKPPLSPPAWLFPVVWTLLYILMGIAAHIVSVSSHGREKENALAVYAVQLFFNFFWSIIFFNLGMYLFAFIWLAVLFVLVIINALLFYRLSKPAGLLFIPYVLWVAFAGYLNLGIYILN